MTESEWIACEKPMPMLTFLRTRVSDRKLRLFACACCRSIQHTIPVGPCRTALEVALRFADGQATADDLARARTAAVAVADHDRARSYAAWAACEAANPSAYQAAIAVTQWVTEQLHRASSLAATEEGGRQAGFLRDIVGNPFHEVRAPSLRRASQNPLVQEIATGIYEGGPHEDMNLLADELERQGCSSWEVLSHCRCAEPHVRGCWVIDRILGYETAPKAGPAPGPSTGPACPAPSERVQEIRRLFAEYLGPKKYRRAVRLAIAQSPGPGLVCCPQRWGDFVRARPEYELQDDELTEVFAFCTVHGCELTERIVRGARDDPALLKNSNFLQARGTQFPHSHGEESDAEWEQRLWVCPECQRLRQEWIAVQPGPESQE